MCYDTLIIGAGFSGLSVLYLALQAGDAAILLDAGNDVGGTWANNRYPGVRTDCESHYYCLTLSRDVIDSWDWSERYPTGPEVRAYLQHFATRTHLQPNIRLGSEVSGIRWNEEDSVWDVRTRSGDRYRARRVVSAMGLLSKANLPAIAGIDSFEGAVLHTAAWPEGGVDLRGQRVGVIGVGSSAVQLIPRIAADVEELVVFQRTPNYVVPANSEKLTEQDSAEIRNRLFDYHRMCQQHPFGVAMGPPRGRFEDLTAEERIDVLEQHWSEGGFHFISETFADLSTNDDAAWATSDFVKAKIRATVTDPAVAELLSAQDYPIGAKRVSTGHRFYETFNQPSVRLVDVRSNPIRAIDGAGIVLESGRFDLDVIICATGFDALTGSLDAIDIVGRGGESLSQVWARDGLRTFLGMTVGGFPNFFMMLGPHTPAGNLVVTIQAQAEWLARAFAWADEHGRVTLESTAAADRAWMRESTAAVESTVMKRYAQQARAWFYGGNVDGKSFAVNTYFGGVPNYLAACSRAERDGYRDLLSGVALEEVH